MNIKKVVAAALCTLFAAGSVTWISACGKNVLPEREKNVILTQSGVTVKWDKVNGAESYEVYHAPSRFAEYELASSQRETVYEGTDKYGYYRVDAFDGEGNKLSSETYSYDAETFGETVHIYSPEDDTASVAEDIGKFTAETSQFYSGRFAALFKKGDYRELDLRMRYYMTFSGLGKLPTDTVLGGFNTYGELSGGNATCNFWCGIENLTVDNTVQWAVSQATSFRRMNVTGGMYLTDQTGKTPWASGGFISDTKVSGTVDAGGQQQWFTRNSEWGNWKNGDINMVYSGCNGKFDSDKYVWPSRWVTELDTTEVMSEKPYLVFDEGYFVCVPELKTHTKGISWGEEDNSSYIPLENFYVAREDYDNSETLNYALEKGKHLLFTPGVYSLESPLEVETPNTVILGLGLATLKVAPENTQTLMKLADEDGIIVAGMMFDAVASTQTLMEVGSAKTGKSHARNPVVLHDLYFRIGGAESGKTFVDKTLVINSNDVIGDNFWVWRADHGVANSVGWDVNRATNGVIVNGDDVCLYGLMVEHFQEYQTIWNGENGLTVFYQSETPYDPPEQDFWISEWNGARYEGYASYKVSDGVQKHALYGAGVYYVASSRLKNVFNLDHGIELPSNAGIRAEHLAIANFLSYGGGIRHIVNAYGEGLIPSTGEKKHFTSFIAGVAVK